MGVIGAHAQRAAGLAAASLACFVLALSPAAAIAAPGGLDPTFGSGGTTSISFGGTDSAWAEALQSNGKIVVAGQTSAGATQGDFAVARVNANGSPDTGFGSGGTTKIDFGGDDSAFAVALAPGGKILVAGETTDESGERFAVARLNADGTLDPTFGSGGEDTISFDGTASVATAVLVAPDGRIVLAGSNTSTDTQNDFAVARLNTDGTLDTTFGSGGTATVDFGGDEHARGAALTPDGRIVLAGDTSAGNGHDFAAARLNPDGSLDTTFGTGGKAMVDFGGDDGADALALQPDGKVVLAGDTTNGAGGGDIAIARLNTGGSLDTTFGTGGKKTVDFGGQDIGRAVALQGDGEILVAGGVLSSTSDGFAVARLSAAGTLDAAFGSGGETTKPFAGGDGVAVGRALAVQGDGKIVVAGVTGALQFGVARLLGGGGTPNGPLPPAPNCGKKVASYVDGQWRCVKAGAAIDDGSTLVAGDVPGLNPAGRGARFARAGLGTAIRRGLLAHAQIDGAAFGAGKERLLTGTFTLRSVGAARRALSKGKVLRPKSRKGTATAIVLLRVRRAVAVVRLTVPSQQRKIVATLAKGYAATLAARLARVLALTPWQRTLDQVSPTGSFTSQVALRMFAIAYGSLPGVRRPSGAETGLRSGTIAIGMVAKLWNELSRAQQTAIDTKLGAPHDSSSPRVGQAADATLVPDPQYQAIAQKYIRIYAAKLPGVQPAPIHVFRASNIPTGFADALPVDANGNWAPGQPVASCRVRVAPSGQNSIPQFRSLFLAHEVFHCFQFAIQPNWPQLGAWVMEGMADWAALAVDPVPASVGAGNYKAYLATANGSLLGRDYDGVGFWGYAEQLGGIGSLWGRIPAILRSGTGPAAFVAAGGTSGAFVSTWASAALRLPAGGPAWNQTDPYKISPSEVASPLEDVGSTTSLVSAPYSLSLYAVQANPDQPLISIIPAVGVLRAATKPGGDLGVFSDPEYYCLGGDCTCPPGSAGTVPAHKDINADPLFLALTGGNEAGAAALTYHSLDEYCHPDEPGGGGGGGASGHGIEVIDDTSLAVLGHITSGSCSFSGGAFKARGSGDGFTMTLRVDNATKPGTYLIPYGSSSTYVTVNGYSSRNPGRGAAGGGVTIKRVRVKKKTRYRIAVAYDALYNAGPTAGILLKPEPGGLLC